MRQIELGLRQITQTRILAVELGLRFIKNNLSVQNLFFPLHDAILFQGHGIFTIRSIRMKGLLSYHNVLLNTKSQVDFDCLLQLHMLDDTEEDKYMS
jgi:hypothetical protein